MTFGRFYQTSERAKNALKLYFGHLWMTGDDLCRKTQMPDIADRGLAIGVHVVPVLSPTSSGLVVAIRKNGRTHRLEPSTWGNCHAVGCSPAGLSSYESAKSPLRHVGKSAPLGGGQRGPVWLNGRRGETAQRRNSARNPSPLAIFSLRGALGPSLEGQNCDPSDFAPLKSQGGFRRVVS